MKTQFTLQDGRCIVKDGVPLATIHGVGQYDPCEVDKLARDVAALPDLVAALEGMILHIEENCLTVGDELAVDQARAALAKVRG